MLVKYTFYPNSIPELKDYVELMAHNYLEARHLVMKYIYLNKTGQHAPEEEAENERYYIISEK